MTPRSVPRAAPPAQRGRPSGRDRGSANRAGTRGPGGCRRGTRPLRRPATAARRTGRGPGCGGEVAAVVARSDERRRCRPALRREEREQGLERLPVPMRWRGAAGAWGRCGRGESGRCVGEAGRCCGATGGAAGAAGRVGVGADDEGAAGSGAGRRRGRAIWNWVPSGATGGAAASRTPGTPPGRTSAAPSPARATGADGGAELAGLAGAAGADGAAAVGGGNSWRSPRPAAARSRCSRCSRRARRLRGTSGSAGSRIGRATVTSPNNEFASARPMSVRRSSSGSVEELTGTPVRLTGRCLKSAP